MVLKLEREDFRREDLSNSEEKKEKKSFFLSFFLKPFPRVVRFGVEVEEDVSSCHVNVQSVKLNSTCRNPGVIQRRVHRMFR